MNLYSKRFVLGSLAGLAALGGVYRSGYSQSPTPRYVLTLRLVEATASAAAPPRIGPPVSVAAGETEDLAPSLHGVEPNWTFRQRGAVSVPLEPSSAPVTLRLPGGGTLTLTPLGLETAGSGDSLRVTPAFAFDAHWAATGDRIRSEAVSLPGLELGKAVGFAATGPEDQKSQISLFVSVTEGGAG